MINLAADDRHKPNNPELPRGPDHLEDMFARQEHLQMVLGVNTHSQEFLNSNVLAAMVELGEFIQTTPWKYWKKQQSLDREEAKEEMIDVMHFLINCCLALNITPQEFYEMYVRKNDENFNRQKRGY